MNPRLQKAYKFIETANIGFRNKDYDSCVSRCYYAMFHASIAVLEKLGIVQAKWSHTALRNTFGKEIVMERRMFSTEISGYLKETYDLRLLGDYKIEAISKIRANDALEMANEFLNKIKEVLNE
ncbi:MAG: HEPN domain-containing protein [Methanosarcinales archaeon]